MHVEKCQNPIKSIEYCLKDNNTVEFGERPAFRAPGAGRKGVLVKDLQTFTEEQWLELPPTTFNAGRKAVYDAKLMFQQPTETADVRGIWYWGQPGVGKSHRSRVEFPDAYIKP